MGRLREIYEAPDNDDFPPQMPRPFPLLLCDSWNDPHCPQSVREAHPEAVPKCAEFLEQQPEEHWDLEHQLTRGGDSPLLSDQLETLRPPGHIQ